MPSDQKSPRGSPGAKISGPLTCLGLCHQAFRECIMLLSKEIKHLDSKTDISNLSITLKEFFVAYQQHNEQEEKVFLAWMDKKKAKTSAKFKKEHKVLDKLFNSLTKAWGIREGKGGNDKAVQKAYKEFVKLFSGHCDLEEKVCAPLIKATKTDEQSATLKEIYAVSGEDLEKTVVFVVKYLKKALRKTYIQNLKIAYSSSVFKKFLRWLKAGLDEAVYTSVSEGYVPKLDFTNAVGDLVQVNYEMEMEEMASLGLTNIEANFHVLQRYDGNAEKAIKVLQIKRNRRVQLKPEYKAQWAELQAAGLKPKQKYVRLLHRFEGDVDKVMAKLQRFQFLRDKQNQKLQSEVRFAKELDALQSAGFTNTFLNLKVLSNGKAKRGLEEIKAILKAKKEATDKLEGASDSKTTLAAWAALGYTDKQLMIVALDRNDEDEKVALEWLTTQIRRNEKLQARLAERKQELEEDFGHNKARVMRAPRARAGKFVRGGVERDTRETQLIKFSDQLKALDEAGFTSYKKNVRILEGLGGDLDDTKTLLEKCAKAKAARKERRHKLLADGSKEQQVQAAYHSSCTETSESSDCD